jgi:hypothetical protein
MTHAPMKGVRVAIESGHSSLRVLTTVRRVRRLGGGARRLHLARGTGATGQAPLPHNGMTNRLQ